ncbi:MAG: altronate dehydratase, partial [Erysipelotrichaceae bacterium]|nr:altronate dehydratase [Erysipelotrichaceae bacterium]
KAGLNLLSAPGNDLVASTALAAAGAQIILFTTGRGTPFASPVPTIKISSNTRLYEKKTNWIDFNSGELVDDEDMTLQQISMKLYDLVMETASGKPVKAEQEGYHDLAIFKQGVTL